MKKLAIIFASLGVMGLMACGPVQSAECAAYLACQEAVDTEAGTDTAGSLDSSYGEGGTCWSTSAEAATACTDACVTAQDANATAYPDIGDCDAA